jgi:uncharacterized protein YndB with AHSA1/START domain/DNA-binding transcriptional ArsR family regulator
MQVFTCIMLTVAGELDDVLATDRVFKALADPTRRTMLDRLRQHNGQTLTELCGQLGMTRQSATQHLGVLAAANLVAAVWHGREKLHYLNPVPIHEIEDRWIGRFERPRLRALSAVKRRAEEHHMSGKPTFVYVTYIRAAPEEVWHALTDPELTAQYWRHRNVSDWQAGSRWEHVRVDGSGIADSVGTVLEAAPPGRLVMTFGAPGDESADEPSVVTFDIEPHGDIVRLTVVHEKLAGQAEYEGVAHGWPAVMSNLKSLLETGSVLPQAPWEMHAELRAAQMARNDPR